MKKIGFLTSSRADYGIYYPLIFALEREPDIEVELLVFGTHLSKRHGKTIDFIKKDGFNISFKVKTTTNYDSPKDICVSMAKTISGFSNLWARTKFDFLFALGDRYEMFAAVASVVPFNIPVGHIHGGETTLGAIDNVFRHSITSMASYHFSATEVYCKRVVELVGSSKNVYNVGALSIDYLKTLHFLTIDEFRIMYSIDLSVPTILVTIHPETVNYENNRAFIISILNALRKLPKYQQVFTMPNADTSGLLIREKILDYSRGLSNVILIESFGSLGYLSCMKHCSFLLGNTSSGFVEASFFPKQVINIGDRQTGRIMTPNILSVKADEESILSAVKQVEGKNRIGNCQIYGEGNAANQILEILKNDFIG